MVLVRILGLLVGLLVLSACGMTYVEHSNTCYSSPLGRAVLSGAHDAVAAPFVARTFGTTGGTHRANSTYRKEVTRDEYGRTEVSEEVCKSYRTTVNLPVPEIPKLQYLLQGRVVMTSPEGRARMRNEPHPWRY